MGWLSKQPDKDHSMGSEVTNQTVMRDLHDSCLNQTVHLQLIMVVFCSQVAWTFLKYTEISIDL